MAEELPQIDLGDPEVWQNLCRYISEAAARSPVARSPLGGLVVLGGNEVERLLRDPRLGAAGTQTLERAGITEGPVHEWWNLILFQSNPPTHTRLRSLLSRAFTPRRAEAMRPRVRAIAEQLVGAALDGGELDATGQYAHDIPVRIISEMLGVPEGDHELFGEWSNDLGLAFSFLIQPDVRARIEAAVVNLYGYVGELIDERRKRPGDDLISALIAAEEAGDRLSEEELRAMVVNLIFAGHDTTKGLISIGLKVLCEHPDQFQLIRREPLRVPAAVEEILRFEPVVGALARTAFEELEICGHEVAEGEFVTLSLAAANWAPELFERPHAFDVTRGSRDHLSFGRGMHFCLGAALARVEAQEALRAVAVHVSELEVLDPPARWVPFAAIRRLESLRLRVR